MSSPFPGMDPFDLTQALQRIYASARYDLRIDYTKDPPLPTLSPDDASWLDEHLKAAGMR